MTAALSVVWAERVVGRFSIPKTGSRTRLRLFPFRSPSASNLTRIANAVRSSADFYQRKANWMLLRAAS
jgi:hypothetical protein